MLLVALALLVGAAAEPDGEVRTIAVSEVRLAVPEAWVTVSGEDSAENLSELVRLNDPTLQGRLAQAASRADLTLVRGPDAQEISPTLRFSIRSGPGGETDYPLLVMREMLRVMGPALERFVPGEITPWSVGTASGYRVAVTYLLPTVDGAEPVQARTVVLQRGSRLLTIGISMAADERREVVAEAEAILNSLRFDEAN